MVSETKTTEAPALRRELKARHLTMIAIGGDEVASGVVRVRDMRSGEETETKMDEAAKCVLAVIKGE